LKEKSTKFLKKTLTATLLVLLTSAGLLFIQPVNAATLTIVSDNGFADMGGGYYVFGEMENQEDSNIQCEKVTATFYDSNNQVIGVKEMPFGFMYIIMPDQKSPFQIHLGDPTNKSEQIGKQVDHYTLDITAKYTSARPLTIDVEWTDNNLTLGILSIEGEVKNSDTETANNTMVFVTCYDKNGEVVCTDFGSIDQKQLAPGQNSSYKLSIICPEVADSIDIYKVHAFAFVQDTSSSDFLTLGSNILMFIAIIGVAVAAIAIGVVLAIKRRRNIPAKGAGDNTQPQ
jgi:hypothetical protein